MSRYHQEGWMRPQTWALLAVLVLLILALAGCAPNPGKGIAFTCYRDGAISFRAQTASIALEVDGDTELWRLRVLDGGSQWDWSPVAYEAAPGEVCGPAIEAPPNVD